MFSEMNLHSNMVRFIINVRFKRKRIKSLFTFQYGQIYYNYTFVFYFYDIAIYIPIWLDLLSTNFSSFIISNSHLHSNMVRFIIQELVTAFTSAIAFTFQYGQIYYGMFFSAIAISFSDLHSNMVRFIIFQATENREIYAQFTFQYGQIYYAKSWIQI